MQGKCPVTLIFKKDLVQAVKTKFHELDIDQPLEDYQPKLDVLVNCAGIIYPGDLDNTFP